ncbi:hypothetical protein LH935_21570 [Gordonia polyisoprenivorans]|uniref:hypothetical protein n=1 Tax=Gordonia polyisoprenivorans TaxID=84595 RepID=UPI002234C63E|nr:hypothetical protein LH935_21570 [Gordonia polyisoprenivorans]
MYRRIGRQRRGPAEVLRSLPKRPPAVQLMRVRLELVGETIVVPGGRRASVLQCHRL